MYLNQIVYLIGVLLCKNNIKKIKYTIYISMSNCKNEEKISSLDDLFKADLKQPFFYKLSLQDVKNDYKDIFESMRKIYMKGLIIHYGNQETNSINIEELTTEKNR